MTCPCDQTVVPFTCPVHGKRMSVTTLHLCQARPDYRELWIRRAAGTERPAPPPAKPRQTLREWLQEHGDRFTDRTRYRPLRVALAIVETHCLDCPDYDQHRETCRRCRGCRGVGEQTYRHSLLSSLGRCPMGYW